MPRAADLLTNVNKAFTHRHLAQSIWQRDGEGRFEYVRIVISQLRQKLEPDPVNPQLLEPRDKSPL